jgi:hypothetical protein
MHGEAANLTVFVGLAGLQDFPHVPNINIAILIGPNRDFRVVEYGIK